MRKMKNSFLSSYLAVSIILIFLSGNILSLEAQSTKRKLSSLESHLQKDGMVNIHTLEPSVMVELKYATTDNFTDVVLYDTLSNAYLHPLAANKLAKAQRYLKEQNPDLCLLVYDAARPLSVQRKMYKVVQGTPKAPYVADPSKTGLHNYGMAVDLTVYDEKTGKPLDMGTPFDHLGYEAQINKEPELIKQGILTTQQVKNRKILRDVMVKAGFLTIRGEWWHFNAVPLTEAKQSYKVIQ